MNEDGREPVAETGYAVNHNPYVHPLVDALALLERCAGELSYCGDHRSRSPVLNDVEEYLRKVELGVVKSPSLDPQEDSLTEYHHDPNWCVCGHILHVL